MTAQTEGKSGPIWSFTSDDNGIVQNMNRGHRATAALSARDHDLFASIKGNSKLNNDRAAIDQLWNSFVAAWFDDKDDPKLVSLQFDAEHAEVWLNESSMLAGVQMLLGIDSKQDLEHKVAEVDLR